MEILRYGLWIWAAALLIGGLIPLFHFQIWWLRAWTYARLQMFILSGLTLIILLSTFGLDRPDEKIVLLVSLIVAVLSLRDILCFTPIWPKQALNIIDTEDHISVSLLVGNVLQDNDDADSLIGAITQTDPDLVFLCETNEQWRQRLSPLETYFEYSYLLPLEDYNGMLFYSKFPIKNVEERYLVQDHIPSLRIDLDLPNERDLRLYAVHPRPPRPEDNTEKLDHELIHVAKEVCDYTKPVIVTGDLNDVGWSRTIKTFLETSGLVDPRRGRGLYNSYNAKIPVVRWPLDHIFHSTHFGVIRIKRLSKFGSDHFPIIAELGLRLK